MNETVGAPAAVRRDWTDLGFTAVYTPSHSHAADFALYRHEGFHPDRAGQYTVPGFWPKGADSNMDQVFDPAEAEPFLECHIKWDGCSHWDMEGAHLCGRDGFDSLLAAMVRLWAWAKEIGMDRL